MNVEMVIRTSTRRSPGFSRSGLSQQWAPAPAGMPPAKAGTPVHHISGLFFQTRQACHRLMNVEMVIRTSTRRSPGFSRSGLSQQWAPAPAGMPPAKAGTPVHHISGLFFQTRQACHRLMNVEMVIRTSTRRSPGFSRSGLSQQWAPAPAGMPPAKAGTPVHHISGLFFQTRQACHRLMNVEMVIRTSTRRSPGFSRSGLSQQWAPAPAGMPLAKAGTPVHHISGLFFQTS